MPCKSHAHSGESASGAQVLEESPAAPLSDAVISTLAANHREFLAFLTRRVGNATVAEDILQDAFVKGMAKAENIRDGEAAVAWFYRLLRNAVVDHWRHRAAGNRALEAVARDMPESFEQADHEVTSAVCACVSRLATTLKPEYADALARVEVGGESLNTYADSLGIEKGNAAVRVHRAREALRKQVQLSCGTCATHGCLNCTCDSAPGHHHH